MLEFEILAEDQLFLGDSLDEFGSDPTFNKQLELIIRDKEGWHNLN